MTYSIVSQPSIGTVSLNGSIATYVGNSIAEDSFTYQASDGIDTSDQGTITIKIISTKTFGGSNYDFANSVIQTSDGGYLLGGSTRGFGNGGYDIYLVKTDADGNEEWSETFGGTNDDGAYSILQTDDGGYLLGGYTHFENEQSQMYLVKTDTNGNEEWSQTYGGSGSEDGYSVIQTSDGGYLLGGDTTSFGNASQMYIVKTDANGNEEWSNDFGSGVGESAYEVIQTSDDGYLVGGYTSNPNNVGFDNIYLVKTDTNGNEEWSQTYGGSSLQVVAKSVIHTSDGGYLLGGYGRSNGSGRYEMHIIKIDSNGSEEWSNAFGSGNLAESVIQTSDGGYLLGGFSDSSGSNDMHLVKTDANGSEEWSKTFGGSDYDKANSVIQTSDGGYLLGGLTQSFGNGAMDMYLVKTDGDGNQEW